MDAAVEEHVKGVLYQIYQNTYFKKIGVNKLFQLNKKQLSEYYREQRIFVEEELGNFKRNLETITKNCRQDIADKICHIFTMSIEGIKQSGEILRHKKDYLTLCKKYNFKYIAEKLRKL